jgi:hypothetical protein
MVFVGLMFLTYLLILKYSCQYDYFQSFITSAVFDTSCGARYTNRPITYLSTRFECICDILLMLSLGLLALFPKFKFKNLEEKLSLSIASGGILIISMAILGGIFRTGETARASMFIYPYLLLLFLDEKPEMIKFAAYLAGFQTVIMQAIGNYFW